MKAQITEVPGSRPVTSSKKVSSASPLHSHSSYSPSTSPTQVRHSQNLSTSSKKIVPSGTTEASSSGYKKKRSPGGQATTLLPILKKASGVTNVQDAKMMKPPRHIEDGLNSAHMKMNLMKRLHMEMNSGENKESGRSFEAPDSLPPKPKYIRNNTAQANKDPALLKELSAEEIVPPLSEPNGTPT